ncbi:hypothetical protein NB231_02283 [Nitrococcus mobilis Nb-231]|uniref:Tyr recombinase domain-containing protein n=1 Tax=Nitrococcus mobilis Nb-231 TaxID=314278 RepID=A4BRI6_9GAMM|nr:hypothetical protein NB231_02283 [Nitrococcus mobilis Nb-231]
MDWIDQAKMLQHLTVWLSRQDGCDVHTARKLLGHKGVSTMMIYTNVFTCKGRGMMSHGEQQSKLGAARLVHSCAPNSCPYLFPL